MAHNYYTDVDRLKIGHSLSMDTHTPVPIAMMRPRSSQVLLSREPSFPALPLDLSADYTNETIERRKLHSAVLAKDPNAFKRKHKDESASATIHNLEKVKNLLQGMHELRDFKDINKSRIYTRSILLKKRSKEDEELEKYQYEHMHPLEDFVRPYDLESRRSTGYEYGHVRSLLKLDTFGPTNSASILKRRAEGELPASPNLDRHNLISPEHELKPSTLVPISSANSSRASSADDSSNYRGAFPSLQSLRRNAERKARASTSPHQDERQSIKAVKGNNDVSDYVMQKNADLLVIQHDQRSETSGRMSMYSQITSFAGPALTASRSVYSSSRPETSSSRVGSRGSARFPDSSFHGVAITEKERILKDPFLRRREWYKSYTRRLENGAVVKELKVNKKNYRREQEAVAEQEKATINDFESHLTLAKFQT